MSKVTSKLQVTVPIALARLYDIQPGDEIDFEAAGDVIRIVPSQAISRTGALDVDARLRLFDAAGERQRAREECRPRRNATTRDWNREDLYERGREHAD